MTTKEIVIPEIPPWAMDVDSLRLSDAGIGDRIIITGWKRERARVSNIIYRKTSMTFSYRRDKARHVYVFTRIA